MQIFVKNIHSVFKATSNSEIAKGQSAYMKNHFAFFGIKSFDRKILQRPFFHKDQRPAKADLPNVIKKLWSQPQRELHYCAQELTLKYVKNQDKTDQTLYEFMVTQKSWWDSVDFIASNLIGAYFKTYPEFKIEYVQNWLDSDNIWLQRSAVLFQLKYKQDVEQELLTHVIHSLNGSKEFFINKAIGWVLREYSKTNPEWVLSFTAENILDKLSQREALKWLNNKNI